jgi:hypothetical protein
LPLDFGCSWLWPDPIMVPGWAVAMAIWRVRTSSGTTRRLGCCDGDLESAYFLRYNTQVRLFALMGQRVSAINSISTAAPSGSAATPIVVRAGYGFENCWA